MRLDYMKACPEGFSAMVGLEEAVRRSTIEPELLELVRTRVSQINGCAFCLGMHNRDARAAGEHQVRLDTLPAWRETPYFSDRERAALAWAESLTTVATTRAPQALYDDLTAVFAPEEIAALTFAIVAINGWNRLAIGLESDVTTLEGLDAPPAA